MKKNKLLVITALLSSLATDAFAESDKQRQPPQVSPQDPEVQQAMSVLPTYLRDDVYGSVLQPRGRPHTAARTRDDDQKQTLPMRDSKSPIPFRSPF